MRFDATIHIETDSLSAAIAKPRQPSVIAHHCTSLRLALSQTIREYAKHFAHGALLVSVGVDAAPAHATRGDQRRLKLPESKDPASAVASARPMSVDDRLRSALAGLYCAETNQPGAFAGPSRRAV